LYEKELDALEGEEKWKRLVEKNVLEQCRNVIKTAAVQKMYREKGYPIVHGWVFDLRDGLLKDLEIGFEETLKSVKKIYNLEIGGGK
jgi:carbonic anhydrase